MYDYGYSYGYGLIGGNTYNPLINYDWSTTTTSGLRYLKDVGSTPAYNASMYFGRGAYLNGVDQSITVPINTTIQTALKRVNGVVTINETSQTLTNYVISGLGVHKDYYLFTRLLTTAEKESYTNTPELFYAMAQADSTCVLNMPMCETDGYVRNMKSYSEGNELVVNGTFASDLSGWQFDTVGGQAVYSAGRCHLVNNGSGFAGIKQVVDYIGQLCLFSFDYEKISGDIRFQVGPNVQISSMETKHYDILVIPSTTLLYFGSSLAGEGYIDNITVKKVTGAYQITNYTSSVRDNANKLQYGLQTCKFVRNSLGVIQSASSFLECDGAGYANTGWTPDLTKKLSIEFIVKNNDNLIENILIGCIDDPTNRLALGFRGTNARILLGNAYPQYAIASTIYYGTLTITGIAGQSIVYINGEYKGLVGESTLGIPLSMFWLGGIPLASYKKIDTRLFKVHNKVLTQAEVTANYNSYVAKGLLS